MDLIQECKYKKYNVKIELVEPEPPILPGAPVPGFPKLLTITCNRDVGESRGWKISLPTNRKWLERYKEIGLSDDDIEESIVRHNVAHIRYTDFDCAKKIATMRAIKRVMLFNITNVLEDVRIDNLMEKEFPPIERISRVIDNYRYDNWNHEWNETLNQIFGLLILKLKEVPEKDFPTIIKMRSVKNSILKIAKRVFTCKNTMETLDVAIEIYRELGIKSTHPNPMV